MTQLNKEQKKYLKTLAHNLKPIVWVGQQGLTENVMAEINTTLDYHELVKVKIRTGDRTLREQIAGEICRLAAAELIQKIGNVIVIYRQNREQPKITLPT